MTKKYRWNKKKFAKNMAKLLLGCLGGAIAILPAALIGASLGIYFVGV